MSLSETQAIFSQLQRIDEILTQITEKVTNLKKEGTEEVVLTSSQAIRILYRINHLARHLGLGEDVNSWINKLQRIVFLARMLQMSINLIATGGPFGTYYAIFGALGLGAAYFTVYDWVRGVP